MGIQNRLLVLWLNKNTIQRARSSGRRWSTETRPPAYLRRARFCFATFAPCLPSAVRVARGSFEIVFLERAAFAAFLMFLRAAAFCFAVAMVPPMLRCRA